MHSPRAAKVDVQQPHLQATFCKTERELHGHGALANAAFARQHENAMLERHDDVTTKPASPSRRMPVRVYVRACLQAWCRTRCLKAAAAAAEREIEFTSGGLEVLVSAAEAAAARATGGCPREYIKLDFGYKNLVAVPSRRVSVRQQGLCGCCCCAANICSNCNSRTAT